MQEEPTGPDRPGDQQPAAPEPAPPPDSPEEGRQAPPPQAPPPQAPPPQAPPPQAPPPPWGPQGGPGGHYPGHGYPGGQGYPGPAQPYPPPGGYPPPAPRRLTRRTDDRVLAGVASGLGTYFGIDPVVFRIGFVALTLAGGTGLLVYLLLWAVLPAVSYGGPGGPPPPPAGPHHGDPPIVATLRQGGVKSYLAVGVMVLAVLLLVGPWARPPVVLALLLIGGGVLLMVQDRPDPASGSGSPWPPGRPTPPAGGGQQPGGQWGAPGSWQHGAPPEAPAGQDSSSDPSRASYATATQTSVLEDSPSLGSPTGWSHGGERDWGPAGSPAAQSWDSTGFQSGSAPAGSTGSTGSPSAWGAGSARVAERQRPRSILGWVTIAAALLAAGVASALDNLGVVNLTPTRVLALVLTVVGVGLLVGSLWGRAWWLILLGLLLVPVTAAASLANDVPVSGRTGDQFERPENLAAVQPVYRLSAGQLQLDLRQVHFGPLDHLISVRIGAGEMRVILPADQPVTVNSTVGAGNLQVLDNPSNGGFQVKDSVHRVGAPGLGQLTLDLHVGVGQIIVSRGP